MTRYTYKKRIQRRKTKTRRKGKGVKNQTKKKRIYSKKQYNRKVILLAFIISSGAVLATGLISHREIKERMHSSEPESII